MNLARKREDNREPRENDMGGPNEVTAKFASMEEGAKEDWEIIGGHYGGFPVDRREHSLQTATCAKVFSAMSILKIARNSGKNTTRRLLMPIMTAPRWNFSSRL